MDPSRVLWIGGPRGSGTSALAQAVAQRAGLQLYSVDDHAEAHEPRLPDTEFARLSPDDRWLAAKPDQMLAWVLNGSRHRFRLVLEDLRALADAPLALVEGAELFPTSVSAVLGAADQALFLVPDPEQQRERLLALGPISGTSDGERARVNATEGDLLITARYRQEARDLRLTVLPAERRFGELVEVAETQFLRAISAAGDRSP
ncbi:MAG TPA: hypothetical protein VNC40_13385 [Gaiellaceae bacterium]|nr:hypothetical protein [Gaiellaceae bacterium]